VKTHPLFAGFATSELVEKGAALGFDLRVIVSQEPFFPMSVRAAEFIRERLGGVSDGFYRVARWEAPGVYCVAMAKPLTAFAHACYLVGLGQVAQDSHQTRSVYYRYSHSASEGLKGWASDRASAFEAGCKDALRQGASVVRTHPVAPPLASAIYSGASVLEDLRLSAYAAVGDESRNWPSVVPDQAQQFSEAHALLVDGFAWHTENIPDFSVCCGSVFDHAVAAVD